MRKRLASILIVTAIAVSSCSDGPNGILAVVNLTSATKHDPAMPGQAGYLFSWQITSGKRNLMQGSYRLQVAAARNGFESTGGLLWDSERVDSPQSLLVPSPMLKPAAVQALWWRVKVWNQHGEESDWSSPARISPQLLTGADWNNARWIGFEEMADEMKVVPGVHGDGNHLGDRCTDRTVVPMFRKEFEATGAIAEATLFISGLGQYEAMINGEKAGNGFLSPGWTNYDKTIFYNTIDVTAMLQAGKNTLGVLVGNGFFNINRERYRKFVIAWGNPMMICQLRIKYAGGTEDIVVSGPGWKVAPSSIIYSSIFGGEDYDARLEQQGWNLSGFDDSAWQEAVLVSPPSGELTPETGYQLEVMEQFDADTIIPLEDGATLYDFGQNASGIVELKVRGKKGQVVRLIPAELITPDNQPNQSASGSPYYFSYTLKGEGIETWRPRFTYYGFRYVKVEGALPEETNPSAEKVSLVDLRLLHTRNSTPSAGSFSCSYNLYNRTYDLINWGIKSNLQSVITDCPHREKLGWLEQTHLMGSAVHFNFNLHLLYSKQVNDMMEARLDNGLVPDIAPEFVVFDGGFRDSPEWGSAAVILPWLIYKWYGDASVIEKAWPMMVDYTEYLKSKSEDHILTHGLGDWYDLGPLHPGEAQLTPKALTATAIYYYDVKLLSEMAAILGLKEEQERFSVWAEEIKGAFNKEFVDGVTGVISTGSQTAMAMPWCVGLVDENLMPKVMQNLEDSIRANGKALTAGDVGFHYLVAALTRSGRSQLLHEMNARDDVPGYGYQLKKGATALTESWAALEIVSNNHLMLGHLMDWFYAGLGGIGQTVESAGYREIVIKPEMVEGISHARATYHSPYGEIRSEWERSDAAVKVDVTIPVNTTALVYLPVQTGASVREGGMNIQESGDVQHMGSGDGRQIYRIGSGVYSFTVE